jgi:hypothetical protein
MLLPLATYSARRGRYERPFWRVLSQRPPIPDVPPEMTTVLPFMEYRLLKRILGLR